MSVLRPLLAGLSLVAGVPALSQVSPAPAVGCAALRNLRLADVRLTDVTDVADSLGKRDNVRVPHCRVSGVIGKSIVFTAMLPKQWNQRMLMGGNGGYALSLIHI